MQQMHNQHEIKIVKEYTLDYCTIQIRDDDIVLLEINDGVNVDHKMVATLTHLADENLHRPFAILSNRIHSYSLSFEAMSALAKYDNMVALAIVVHPTKSRILIETQNLFISTIKKKPIKIFMDFNSAVIWLQKTLQDIRANT